MQSYAVSVDWPDPATAPSRFYDLHLSAAIDLRGAMRAGGFGAGSGRPSGNRNLRWATVLMVALGGLEAGLEDLVLSAHAHRLGTVGQAIADTLRESLVGRPLQAPNERKLENLLLMSFGVELTTLPHPGFDVLRKPSAQGGTGQPHSGPTSWHELRLHFGVLSKIRNATAHGELTQAAKPKNCEGDLWVATTTGWSIQQPHATSGLRSVVEIYNTVANSLAANLGFTFSLDLRSPEEVIPA